MSDTAENRRPRTGFAALDRVEAPRPPRTLAGVTVISDPTGSPSVNRVRYWDSEGACQAVNYRDIDKAYNVDSYLRQGVDKYVELAFIRGWHYDCETDEPIQYLERRFQLMGIMTRKPFRVLIAELLNDILKYHNCYWIKKRGKTKIPVPGIPDSGALGNSSPILGYFRADPKRLRPNFSPDGKRLISYTYTVPTGEVTEFKANDVIHFTLNVQAGEVLGNPHLGPVLDDIRTYRQCEEYVIKLLYKHLNPLLHHKVTEKTPGFGASQSDVDDAALAHAYIAPDGMIVTPPNHEIVMIGAESRALRGEGYMALIKQRVFTGLGVSQVAMGEGENSTAGSADAQTATMHNKAHFIQAILAEELTEFVLWELLLEGGYDPTSPMDTVSWKWNDFEIETLVKIENNEVQKFTNNLVTESEARRRMGYRPLTDEQRKDTYVQRVTIPVAKEAAQAKADATGAASAVASKNKPSNQHGQRSAPKVKPK